MFGRTKIKPAHSVKLVRDQAGTPAVDLTKVRAAGHVDLAKRADKAGVALSKRGLAGVRAECVLVLDHSGSMHSDYRSGAVQAVVERALGFALQVDGDGQVPVIAFDSRVWPVRTATVSTYQGIVEREIWQSGRMGSTDLAGALRAVQALAEDATAPMFVTVVTDGNPNDRRSTTDVVCELARYPVFLKFLAVRPVDYLAELDDLETVRPGARLLDNVDTKFMTDYATMTDLAFADAMVDEWDSWITAARRAGVLTD